MKTIKQEVINEIIIEKSKFITLIKKVRDLKQVEIILDDIKQKYKSADHYCYAYIIDSYEKCSDDGEPSKTAGMPILNVLKKQELNYVLAVVVRYFGGIKLGAGGLVRAYSKSAVEALEQTNILPLIEYYHVCFQILYEKQREIDSIIDLNYFKKEFKEVVLYDGMIKKNDFPTIQKIVLNLIIIEEKKEI